MSAGYLGSPSLLVSKANQEIINAKPANWTYGYKLYKFSFDNTQNCTVIINGKAKIFLKAGQGFEMNVGDEPITSFVIVESGIEFVWIGGY